MRRRGGGRKEWGKEKGKGEDEEEEKEKEGEGEDREGVHIGVLDTPSYVHIMRTNGLTSPKVH